MTTPHHSEPAREAVAHILLTHTGLHFATQDDADRLKQRLESLFADIQKEKAAALQVAEMNATAGAFWAERARNAEARAASASASPAPPASGGLEAVREAMETSGPYEARICKDMPAGCCDYGVVSLSEGREVCRVWREQDARAIAAALAAPAATGGEEAGGEIDQLKRELREALELVDAIKGTDEEFREAVERAGFVGSTYIVHALDELVSRAELAEAALQALSTGSTGSAEGWVLVPREPKDGVVFFGIDPDDAYPQPMRWQAYSHDEAEEIGEPEG